MGMATLTDWAKAIEKHEGFYPPSSKHPKGSASFRNNNPGNFRCSSLVMGELGAIKCVNNLAVFPDYVTGFTALVKFLQYACTDQLKRYRGDMTLLQFYQVYAPSSDGNNPINYATDVANQLGVTTNTQIREFLEDNKSINGMKNYHLFAHMDRNLVKKGDRVIQYVTPIGTVGDGNGQYYAHLHFSISNGLTPAQLKSYISGWSKARVQNYYKDPRKVDFAKMFGTKMDVGNFGYDWLQWVGYGYHPGVDVNGLKGGNTDFGMPFKSSCNGTVIYEVRTWLKNGGWGNIIILEEQ